MTDQLHILRKIITDLTDELHEANLLLEECQDFVEPFAEVIDGEYGKPSPNWAMKLQHRIDENLHGRK